MSKVDHKAITATLDRRSAAAARPTRRASLLATIGTAVAAAVVLPAHAAGSPDAELIAQCTAFDTLTRQFDAACDIKEGVDDEALDRLLQRITDEQSAMLDALDALRATTPQGIQARACSLALSMGELCEGGELGLSLDAGIPGELVKMLLRDALAIGEGA